MSPQLKFQVYIYQVRAQIGRGILHGSKDADLDEIKARLDPLEAKQEIAS